MDFPNPPSQYKHLKIGLGLFGLLLLAGFALLFNTNRLNNHESLQTTDSSEPTITNPAHSSQFLNTKPGVHFVGSPACATCHEKISESYQQHPMSRSMSLAWPMMQPRWKNGMPGHIPNSTLVAPYSKPIIILQRWFTQNL